jgi:hypothetical protein
MSGEHGFWPFGDLTVGVATLIAAVVSAIVAYIVASPKAKRLICKEVPNSIASFDRLQFLSTPELTYKGQTITKRLSATKVAVYNSGTDTIVDPQIIIKALGPIQVLDVIPDDDRIKLLSTVPSQQGSALLKIECLDSYRLHSDQVTFTSVFDGALDVLSIEKDKTPNYQCGWSVRFYSIDSQRSRRFITDLAVVILVLIGPLIFMPGGVVNPEGFVRPVDALAYYAIWSMFVGIGAALLGHRRDDIARTFRSLRTAIRTSLNKP